jgi:hypothetical protein
MLVLTMEMVLIKSVPTFNISKLQLNPDHLKIALLTSKVFEYHWSLVSSWAEYFSLMMLQSFMGQLMLLFISNSFV